MKPASYENGIGSMSYPPATPQVGDVLRIGRETQIVKSLVGNKRGDIVVTWEGVVEYDKKSRTTKGVCTAAYWSDKKVAAERIKQTLAHGDADESMEV